MHPLQPYLDLGRRERSKAFHRGLRAAGRALRKAVSRPLHPKPLAGAAPPRTDMSSTPPITRRSGFSLTPHAEACPTKLSDPAGRRLDAFGVDFVSPAPRTFIGPAR